jgi:hypothetical protein
MSNYQLSIVNRASFTSCDRGQGDILTFMARASYYAIQLSYH